MPDAIRRKLVAHAPLLLAALVVVTYLPALVAGSVWDDDVNVVTNGALRTLSGLGRIWTDLTVTQQYYPLTHTTFWLQYQTSGLWFPAYHAVNIALHATAAILFLFVLRRLAVRGAELAAALFAVHPVNVESVAWITERKNVLSGALVLAACLAYLRFDDAEHAPARRRSWALALLLFVLALAAKTAVAVVPAALLVVLVLLRRRRLASALLPLAPFFPVGIAAGLFTAYLERGPVGARGAEFDWSFPFRLLVAGRAFFFYLAKLILPIHLAFFYPRWDIEPRSPVAWLYPIGAAALLVTVLVLYRRGRLGADRAGGDPRTPGPLAALLVYAALIFPALGFFNIYFMRFAYVQNHFAYLASMPVLALVAVGLTRLTERSPRASFALAGLPVVCAVLSMSEATTFRDSETLYRVALERNPAAWVASDNLGLQYQRENRPDAAVAMFRAALAVRPEDPQIAGHLGTALAEGGHLDEALPLLGEAAKGAPTNAEGRYNYGAGLEMAGRHAEAVAEYREAVRLKEDWPRPQRKLAWLLATTDDPAVRDGRAAVPLASSACALTRTTATVARCLDTLAAAYAAAGDFENASASAARAVELGRAAGEKTAAYEARAQLYARGEAFVAKRR